jgi:hypothetical protein
MANRTALRRCWIGALKCLESSARKNLGGRVVRLGQNEKLKFGTQTMQKCDRVIRELGFGEPRRASPTRHPFG